jgi:phosphatidylglycerophosphate synthase
MSGQAPAPGRPSEIEGVTNVWLIHPISRRVVDVLARTAITPNQVSVASVFFAAAGAASFAALPWPISAFAGLVLLLAWHVLDGADGDLARRTGRASPIGELVDGVCDHASQACVYIGLGWIVAHNTSVSVAVELGLAAAASHFVQANGYETGRKTYRRWVYGAAWMRQTQSEGGNIFQRLLGGLYIGLSNLMAPGETALERALEPKLAEGGNVAAEIRANYRRANVFIVKRSGLLSSNSRTLAAFLAVLAQHPGWFFIYEITVLNGVLLAVLAARAIRNRALAARYAA